MTPVPPTAATRALRRAWLVVPGLLAWACASPPARTRTPPPAEQWTAPAALPAGGGVARQADRISDFAADAGGGLHLLLLQDADGDGRTDRLAYAGFRGGRWTEPVVLDATPATTAEARVVVDGGGRVHAFWYEAADDTSRDPSRLLHRVRDGGAWGEPEELHAFPPDSTPPHPALAAGVDAEGRVHVVHPDMPAGFVDRVWDGGGWRPLPAGPDGVNPRLGGGAGRPPVLADVRPVTISFLPGGDESHGDVEVRQFRDGGWSEPVLVHYEPAAGSYLPQVVRDGRGVLHALWLEATPGETLPIRMLHALSRDGRVWTPARPVLAPTPGRALYSPRLAVDGAGRLHATFSRFRSGVTDPEHLHATYSDGRWSVPTSILPELGARNSELELAADSEGRVHALWRDARGVYRHAWLAPASAPRAGTPAARP